MRPDRIAPLTWMLGAAAAWAVLGAALAAAGMGGSVAPSTGDAAAAQPLPQPASEGRVSQVVPYTALATRPPFAQDRRPHPFSLPGSGSGDARADANAFDYVLTSVMLAPRFRMAIIEPSQGGESLRVREGGTAEGLGGWRLVELHPRTAVFEGPGGRRELELRLWAGGDPGMTGAVLPPAPQQPVLQQSVPQQPVPQQPEETSMAVAPEAAQDAESPARASVPATPPASTQVTQQMEAIRRRIEARRAQLRREAAQQPGAPARNP